MAKIGRNVESVAVLEKTEINEVKLSKEEQALINKAVLDSNNSEKQHKDIMLMNVKDLESHIKYLKENMVHLDNEYRSRRKLVDGINGSIAGAQAELSSVRANVFKEHDSLVKELHNKLDEVKKSDETLRKLINENNALLISNKHKESNLIEEKRICNSQVFEMKKTLSDNQSQWNSRENDILIREKSLNQEKELFYAERESLIPEMARISAIKNENILLIQQIEYEKSNNRKIALGIESERQMIEETKLVESSRQKSINEKFANEEKRLREWEQNLKDFELESKAKVARAGKLLRQFQLEKEASNT